MQARTLQAVFVASSIFLAAEALYAFLEFLYRGFVLRMLRSCLTIGNRCRKRAGEHSVPGTFCVKKASGQPGVFPLTFQGYSSTLAGNTA